MKVYDGKNLKYQDKLAKKRRKIHILKILFFVGLLAAIVGFILYLLFFSGLLEISQINVNGLDKVSGEKFNSKLNERLNKKWLGLLEYQKNTVLFSSGAFKTETLAAFPEISQITVNKEPPHMLNINITERIMAGIWCFKDVCKYFDKEGVMWGEAAKSLGFLILVVEDSRLDVQEVDRDLLNNIMLISEWLKEKNIFINKFIIPESFIGDFSAFTSGGYELMFSTDSDIKGQLEVLEIFLAEKRDDPNFKPQYIDLRISGRVYYK